MTKKLFLFVFFGMLLISSAHTETFSGPTKLMMRFFDTLTVNGQANLKLVKTQTLTVNGTLTFSSLDVAQNAEINGPLKGNKGKFGDLTVHGPVEVTYVICNKLNVTGPVTASYLEVLDEAVIYGTLTADNSKLHNLTIETENFTLDAVRVDNIVVKSSSASKEQTLILKGKTIISGDITFESGKGIVSVQGSEVQIKGHVKGATTKP